MSEKYVYLVNVTCLAGHAMCNPTQTTVSAFLCEKKANAFAIDIKRQIIIDWALKDLKQEEACRRIARLKWFPDELGTNIETAIGEFSDDDINNAFNDFTYRDRGHIADKTVDIVQVVLKE